MFVQTSIHRNRTHSHSHKHEQQTHLQHHRHHHHRQHLEQQSSLRQSSVESEHQCAWVVAKPRAQSQRKPSSSSCVQDEVNPRLAVRRIFARVEPLCNKLQEGVSQSTARHHSNEPADDLVSEVVLDSLQPESWSNQNELTSWLKRLKSALSCLVLRTKDPTPLIRLANQLNFGRQLALVRQFCSSFLTYQLETLLLLVAIEHQQLAADPSSHYEHVPSELLPSRGSRSKSEKGLLDASSGRKLNSISKRRRSLLEMHQQQAVSASASPTGWPQVMPKRDNARSGFERRRLGQHQGACWASSSTATPDKLSRLEHRRAELTFRSWTADNAIELEALYRQSPSNPLRSHFKSGYHPDHLRHNHTRWLSSSSHLKTSTDHLSDLGPGIIDPDEHLVKLGDYGINPTAEKQCSSARSEPSVGKAELSASQSVPASLLTIRKKAGVVSKLSLLGARRRFGFKQKSAGLSSLSVQRSEEVLSSDASRYLSHQTTLNSTFSDSVVISDSTASPHSTSRPSSAVISLIELDPRRPFVDGLGPGQVASRQVLVSPIFGEIQLSLSSRRSVLELEVIRARRLLPKPGARSAPVPYVKVYLMRNRKCLGKFKTERAKAPSLDPLFQARFTYRHDYLGANLQVIVWADYGKHDRKSLMGLAQIQLADLDISSTLVSWYRLFNAPSLASDSYLSSKALRHTL